MLPSPFQAGLFGQWTRNLPPGRDLVIGSQLLLKEFLITGIDQGIILQSPSRRELSLFDQLDFLPRRFVKNVFRMGDAVIGVANEVVDINDARFASVRRLRGIHQENTAKYQQQEAVFQ